MMYFAATDVTELSILLGAVFAGYSGLLLGFYKYAQAREKDFEKSRNNQTAAFDKTIEKLSRSIDANVQAHKEVARETREMKAIHQKGYQEAEKRNGHLAELQIEARGDVLKAIKGIKVQNIKEQNVEHQIVENKE